MFQDFLDFLIFFRVFRAPEGFRRLPGARGVIFPEYEPVASHGDPFHARNYFTCLNLYVSDHICCRRYYFYSKRYAHSAGPD